MRNALERALVRLLPASSRRDVAGDVREEAAAFVAPVHGARAAHCFRLQQLARAVVSLRVAELQRILRTLRSSPPGRDTVALFLHDLRFAGRSLRRAPTFSLVVATMFLLGLTANLAAFALLEAGVLRGLPYLEPDALVDVWTGGRVSRASFERLEAELAEVDGLAAYAGYDLTLLDGGDPTVLDGERVTADYFDVLGAPVLLGRDFSRDDSLPGAEPVVLLSEQVWRERFSADPAIVGTAVRLDGGGVEQRTVVGIVPAEFRALVGSDRRFWVPLVLDPDADGYYGAFLRLVGRLGAGSTTGALSAELLAAAERLHADGLVRESVEGVRATSLQELAAAGTRSSALYAQGAAAGLIVLAVVNTINLLLSRWQGRARELAMRRALGARRGSVARQLVLEVALVAAAALLLAVPATLALLPALATWLELPRVAEPSVWPLAGFGGVLAVVTVLLCGVPAALVATRSLSTGSAGTRTATSDGRWRSVLVIAQVATALVLSAGAGLAVKSVWHLGRQATGFAPDGVVLMQLSPLDSRYAEPSSRVVFYESLLERLGAVPGVRAVGASHVRPMTLETWTLPYHVAGAEPEDGEETFVAMRIVTSGYHEAVGEQLLAGRAFDGSEVAGDGLVTVVNESFARRYWGDPAAAVGESFRLYSAEGPPIAVLGVVADVRQHELSASPEPALYLHHAHSPRVGMHVAVRVERDPLAAIPALRDAVWSLDETVPITGVSTFDAAMAETLGSRYGLGNLLAVVAALALILGTAGVYSVLTFVAQNRRREIAVRLALGAAPATVRRSMALRMLRLVATGVGIGVVASILLWRGVESQLYATRASDPVVLIGSAALLALAGLIASYGPVRRAAATDPAGLLHGD